MLVLDLFFVGWIYLALKRVKEALASSNQTAKLEMYSRLTMVIMANIFSWFVVTLIMVSIRMGGLPLPWKSLFIFANFWDVNYFLVLISIAWLWFPGAASAAYAYSQQLPTNEADAEEAAGGDFAADVPPPGSFTIQNEDDEDEDSSEQPAPGKKASLGRGAQAVAAESDDEADAPKVVKN